MSTSFLDVRWVTSDKRSQAKIRLSKSGHPLAWNLAPREPPDEPIWRLVAKFAKSKTKMARPKRFELLTPRFVVWCSIQLSYGRLIPLPEIGPWDGA